MTAKSLVQNGIYSHVQVYTGNGYGSATTSCIRRFTTTMTNIGASITYADSATNGASFTVNVSGIYAISYSDRQSNICEFGISRNASALTTQIASLAATEVLSATHQSTAASRRAFVGWCGYLNAGDIIRAHGDTTGTGVDADSKVSFAITQIS